MIEYYEDSDKYITRRGSNSKTSNASDFLKRMENSFKILRAYFTVCLEDSSDVKFGIKLPDKLEVIAAHRPFIYDIVEEMGLMGSASFVKKHSLCESIENIWEEELSRQELLAVGIDIDTLGWKKFFGKSKNTTNYYFCDKCYKRHAVVSAGAGFLAVDERGECPVEYNISQKDLALFMFKKKLFFGDLQKNVFGLDEEELPETKNETEKFYADIDRNLGRENRLINLEEDIIDIVPGKSWQIGTTFSGNKIYFVFGRTQEAMDDAIFRTLAELDGHKSEDFIMLATRGSLVSSDTRSAVEAKGGYLLFLNEFLLFDLRRHFYSKEKLSTMLPDLSMKNNNNGKAEITKKALTITNKDEGYRKNFPRAKPPFPSEILHKKYKLKMKTSDIAKSCGCSPRKIRDVLSKST